MVTRRIESSNGKFASRARAAFIAVQSCREGFKSYSPWHQASVIVRMAQLLRQELKARVTYAAQIELRLGDLACEHLDVSAGVPPRDLTCEGLHLFTVLGQTGRGGSNRGGTHFLRNGYGHERFSARC